MEHTARKVLLCGASLALASLFAPGPARADILLSPGSSVTLSPLETFLIPPGTTAVGGLKLTAPDGSILNETVFRETATGFLTFLLSAESTFVPGTGLSIINSLALSNFGNFTTRVGAPQIQIAGGAPPLSATRSAAGDVITFQDNPGPAGGYATTLYVFTDALYFDARGQATLTAKSGTSPFTDVFLNTLEPTATPEPSTLAGAASRRPVRPRLRLETSAGRLSLFTRTPRRTPGAWRGVGQSPRSRPPGECPQIGTPTRLSVPDLAEDGRKEPLDALPDPRGLALPVARDVEGPDALLRDPGRHGGGADVPDPGDDLDRASDHPARQ